MTWFRVDDKFARHPKVKALRAEGARVRSDALAIWLLCGVECACALGQGGVEDGFVSRADLEDAARPLSGAALRAAVTALVRVGLWVEEGDGWRFHDWTQCQKTSDKVRAERAKWRGEKAPNNKRKSPSSAAEYSAEPTEETLAEPTAEPTAESAADSGADSTEGSAIASAASGSGSDPIPIRRESARSLSRDGEIVRAAIAEAFAARNLPRPREVAHLDGKHALDLARWCRDVAKIESSSVEAVIGELLAKFLANDRAKAKGFPISWLAANPLEYRPSKPRLVGPARAFDPRTDTPETPDEERAQHAWIAEGSPMKDPRRA